MNVFEALFFVFALLGVLVVASMANSLRRGKRRSAWMTLRVYLILAVPYLVVVVATTLALPIQVLPANGIQYSGDWSIAVASLRRVPHDLDEDYEVDFRLGNRGSRPIHGEKRLVAYLVSEDGTRYNAAREPSTPPFDVGIRPGNRSPQRAGSSCQRTSTEWNWSSSAKAFVPDGSSSDARRLTATPLCSCSSALSTLAEIAASWARSAPF